MKIKDNDISIVRGDTESLTIQLLNGDGSEILLSNGDIVYFTVKRNTTTDIKILQKVITSFGSGKIEIFIDHNDTKDLVFGDYVYDCQINFMDGRVKTILGPNTFSILSEVTYE